MPDVEQTFRTALAGLLPNSSVVTELPRDLTAGVVQVERLGGPTLQLGLAQAIVDVDCYAANRETARALAIQVDGIAVLIRNLTVTGLGVISYVGSQSGPSARPYDNTSIRRFGMTYQVHVH